MSFTRRGSGNVAGTRYVVLGSLLGGLREGPAPVSVYQRKRLA